MRIVIFAVDGLAISVLNDRLRSARISALARARELRAGEQRFRLLVGAVKDYAIFMLNPAGYVVSWTAGAEQQARAARQFNSKAERGGGW